ncbi:hypothetical protein BJ944DRAFT_241553 [Cunninghamella echinulata]|nr:hypothetical protein BJ944DRAFT_241553 [Cunninghamella echinulata]
MVSSTNTTKSNPTVVDAENKQPQYYQPHIIPIAVDQNGNIISPTSPPYLPYIGNYIDTSGSPLSNNNNNNINNSYDRSESTSSNNNNNNNNNGNNTHTQQSSSQRTGQQQQQYAYVYPISPQYSVQYYTDYNQAAIAAAAAGYQSYPGSPILHPQSPHTNPTSPPFSPTYHFQGANITLSPPMQAYVIPPPPPGHHHQQPFPPLHISSPVLTGHHHHPSSSSSNNNNNIAHGSPPQHHLPGPYYQQQQQHRSNHQQRQQQHGSKRSNHHHQHEPRYQSPPPPSSSSYNREQQQLIEEELIELTNNNEQYHSHNMYVRGLTPTMTDESFLELCANYGNVLSSKAILDQKTNECKGYGFAMYENEEDCLQAIEMLNNSGLQASLAKVGQESFSSKLRNLQDENSTNIYISNLPLDMSEQKLEELFLPCQTISNRILRDPHSGISRGVGFARLTDRYSAQTIIDKFNGQTIGGSSAALQVRFADSPAQKKLKHQTARKRLFKTHSPHDFQSMSAISLNHPVTPETMLGLASSIHHLQQQQSTGKDIATTTSTTTTTTNDGLVSPPSEEDLVSDINKKLQINDNHTLVNTM